jgi:hypothetical protein
MPITEASSAASVMKNPLYGPETIAPEKRVHPSDVGIAVDPQLVVAKIKDELKCAARKYSFFQMRRGVALIKLQILDEV